MLISTGSYQSVQGSHEVPHIASPYESRFILSELERRTVLKTPEDTSTEFRMGRSH